MKHTELFAKHLFLFMMFAFSILTAETSQITTPANIVCQKTDAQNAVTYDLFGISHIGRESKSGEYKYFVYRSHDGYSRTSIGIPAGVIIDDVTLILSFSTNQQTKTMKVVTVSSQPSLSDGSPLGQQ